ncbi:MAG: hypothetical protein IPJ46_09890 [Anaerolineales bacterium]|nr:hypothetical protein [Anaerolineales bacterium]
MKYLLNQKFALPATAILILIIISILFLPKLLPSSPKINIALHEELILPKLNGQFKVGKTTVHMIEKDRPALPGLTAPREWVVIIFYPADPEAGATPGPYAEEELNTAYTDYSLTKESAGALDHIHSNAYWNAAANHSAGKFPVLLFHRAAANSPCFTQPCLSRSAVLVTLWSPFQNRSTPR